MRNYLSQLFIKAWYKPKLNWLSSLCLPLASLFWLSTRVRLLLYRLGFKKTYKIPVPIVVVGNISVGGTGKTPLVIYLANLLKVAGYTPGIISRGYGGKAPTYPFLVSATTPPKYSGDEPVLLAAHTHCPVVVDPQRVRAAHYLSHQTNCDVLISDDGLQHTALGRDLEIAVVDGARRFGNSHMLPAGPLREPLTRLKTVDFIVNNGVAQADEWEMQLNVVPLYHLHNRQRRTLESFAGQTVHAIAAIGNPQRFFRQLTQAGLTIIEHAFPDHYSFKPTDLDFAEHATVIMTEKDAVKCQHFPHQTIWVLAVYASLTEEFNRQFLGKLKAISKTSCSL